MTTALTIVVIAMKPKPSDEQLCARVGVAGVDELRQEGDEEQHDLRIGQIDQKAAEKGAAQSAPAGLALELQRRPMPKRAERQPQEVERAGDLDRLIGLGRRGEQRRKPERRGKGMDDESGVRARLRREPLPPAPVSVRDRNSAMSTPGVAASSRQASR